MDSAEGNQLLPWHEPLPQIRTGRFGFMAVTPPDFPYRIAVIGPTKMAVESQFVSELAAWKVLRDRLAVAVTPV